MGGLADFLNEHLDEIIQPYLDLVKQRVERYGQADPSTFPANTRRMVQLLPVAVEDPSSPTVQEYVAELCQERFPAGFLLGDTLSAMFLYNDIILPLIWRDAEGVDERYQLVLDLEHAIEVVAIRFAHAYVDYQRAVLEAQRRTMLELSTPVIKVWDGILALPLVGTVDSYRARQIMEELLTAIVAQQASIVLIDITGVPVVDTMVADHLIKTIRAAELLGAECLLVGIGPDLAQTVVALGVDLRNITSAADMRQGLTLAFNHLGLEVIARPRA